MLKVACPRVALRLWAVAGGSAYGLLLLTLRLRALLLVAAALVFRGIGFFDVGLAVFTRRYGFLVRHLVRYSSRLAAKSDAELAALLRSRLAPVR